MGIYDKVKIKYRDERVIISGLGYHGLLILVPAGALLVFFPVVFSLLFYPIKFISLETLLGIAILTSLFVFGFGYKIVINKSSLIYYEINCFIPFKKIVGDIDLVEIRRLESDSSDPDKIIISTQFDPWGEMGCSDWVSISYQGKEYDFGGNNNYDLLIKAIDEAVCAMKNKGINP